MDFGNVADINACPNRQINAWPWMLVDVFGIAMVVAIVLVIALTNLARIVRLVITIVVFSVVLLVALCVVTYAGVLC